ncbi:MAG: TAXI family TRAP transporter solute-binding subunit [Pseudomonadota bacterium]
MTLKKTLLCSAAAALVATASVTAPTTGLAEATEPVDLSVASFSQRSSWYAYAVGLAEMLRDVLPEGSVIDTPPEGGGTSNALLVSADRFDMGFGMASVAKWAESGAVVYDEPVTNLRALLGGLDQYYLAIAVTGDDQPASLDEYLAANPDLNVALRQKGSAGAEGGIQMLTFAGASPEEIAEAGGSLERVRSFGIIRDLMVADNADLWIHTVTAGHPAMTEVSQTVDVSFPAPSDDVLASMEAEYGWVPAVMPAGTFKGQDADVTVPGTTSILMVNDEFPDELAYTIVKTVCEDVETFQSVHRALAGFTCAEAFQPENTIIPLHPGAERYFKEAGLM